MDSSGNPLPSFWGLMVDRTRQHVAPSRAPNHHRWARREPIPAALRADSLGSAADCVIFFRMILLESRNLMVFLLGRFFVDLLEMPGELW